MERETHRNFANVEVVWEPGPDSSKRIKEYKKSIENKHNVKLRDYWDIHKWSLEHLKEFWADIWDLIGIVYSRPYEQVIDLNVSMTDSPEWFPGARLNYAENILRFRDQHIAIISTGEDRVTETVTYAQMYEETRLYAAAFKRCGLAKGDRVVCFMSNRKEPVFAMLAATSMGAIWSGALPLMGAQAVVNRFKQVSPKILITIDRFLHNGEENEMLHKVKEIAEGCLSLEKVIVVPSKKESRHKDISHIKNSCWLDDFLETGKESDGTVPTLEFEQVSFSHPVFISYTSGTTGLPKALMHGFGVILTTARDIWLHGDAQRENVWLSMSPVGWVTWNIFTTLHVMGITVVLFEGVPYFITRTYLWDMVDEFKISNLFLSVRVLDDLEKKGYLPTEKHELTSLMTITCGGSVVKPQNYDFVYEKVKSDVIFSSFYASTEVMGSCITFDRTLKIHKGEIPCPSLGIDIQMLDDKGKPLIGEVGEIVIANPAPSLPLGIWDDKDNSRFKETYLEKFPGTFSVGDLGMINPITKGIIICGRSDDTLKPRGCRFGSSEIYNIVETFPEIRDSLCVSQYDKDKNERAVLFLKLRDGHRFDEPLIRNIRAAITRELTSNHVPEVILEVADVPYNLNGKKMEILVKKIINNMPYNPETVINPESLEHFFNIPELRCY